MSTAMGVFPPRHHVKETADSPRPRCLSEVISGDTLPLNIGANDAKLSSTRIDIDFQSDVHVIADTRRDFPFDQACF